MFINEPFSKWPTIGIPGFLTQESSTTCSTDKDEDEKLPPNEYVLNEVRKYLEKTFELFK